jgi:putative tryptophan/tyrosine transport system substrate-binding protein
MRLARVTVPAVFALSLFAAQPCLEAQPAGRVPRIGYLCSPPCAGPRHKAFVESLEEFGYVDGRTITLVYPRYPASEPTDVERLPELAVDLAQQRVDVIFAARDVLGAQAAKLATQTIPIVVAVAGDPVKQGLVASLARPGGNLTGITYLEDQLVFKQIELLKEIAPQLARVGALVDSADSASSEWVARLETAARSQGLQLDAVQVRAPTTFDDAFAALSRRKIGALVVMSSPNHFLQASRIAALASQRRIVAVASFREFAEARGLLAYGPRLQDVYRRAASLADRILKGARSADLPVEQPTRFELLINLLVARDLGLTIPSSVLARADEVIQ